MANDLANNQDIPSNALARIIFVILFNFMNMIVSKLILLVALYQFLCHLFTGKVSRRSIRWGEAMSNWTYRMLLFMTYKTECMPFPLHKLGADPEKE